MKDLIVGCITNYNYDKIKYWINSIDQCGFSGDKVMICYNVDYDTCEKISQKGFTIFGFNKNDEKRTLEYKDNFSIVVERFFHQWLFLKQFRKQYRYIISTDVKDVIFQTNPSTWLETNIRDKKINVACESIRYENEEWGNNNLLKSFGPSIHDDYKHRLIFNAGTISGDFDTMLDLFLNIFLVCNGTNHFIDGGGGPDQAALNVLLGMKPYRDVTNFAMSEDGYAAQLGTTGPQIQQKYSTKLIENTPILRDGIVCTSEGKPFSIVHQYDRVPEWKNIIENRYS